MLAYSKTYEEFCGDINKGQIVSAIVTALNRDFSDSEKRAFRNSLSSVKNALSNANIPNAAQVGILVVDWYKDEMPREKVEDAIRTSLDEDLPESYDKESFQSKITLLLNHFIDMAIQGYGWIGKSA